jgi:hypothetical protein
LIGSEVATGFAGAWIYGLRFTSQITPINKNVQNLSPEGDVAVVVIGPILATNVLATAFIAWKAWYVVPLFLSGLLTKIPSSQGLPPNSGYVFQKG